MAAEPVSDEFALFDRRDLHANDLPPKWDGLSVEWQGWEPSMNVFVCPPTRSEKCQGCGSSSPAQTNRGVVHISYSTHVRPIRRDPRLRSILFRTLTAFRCPDCFLDTVTDCTGPEFKTWVLDEADYGDDGSWE